MRSPAIGSSVVYVDTFGKERPALVTANHGGEATVRENCSLNVVIVADDETKGDGYGRQIERVTSVVHQSSQQAPGNYWR